MNGYQSLQKDLKKEPKTQKLVGLPKPAPAVWFWTRPIYFTIPRFHTVKGNLTIGRGANLSAKALLNAHSRATAYFLATDGSDSQVRSKLWEYIRDEFRNGSNLNGGIASFTPPLGGFNGPITNYVTTTFFTDSCD